MAAIRFFNEQIKYNLVDKRKIKDWIKQIIHQHQKKQGDINFILCSDEHLLKINQDYLQHDTYTDIITFDNSDGDTTIEGDIYISIERVRENAEDSMSPVNNELLRVMIHGILHLIGYKDKTVEQEKEMRRKEDECLSLLN